MYNLELFSFLAIILLHYLTNFHFYVAIITYLRYFRVLLIF